MLSDEMKAERVRISRELLERFEKEDEDFLKKINTGDETWVHHYEPETKRQSMEYRHKESLQPKKIQDKTPIFLRTDVKNYCSVGRSVLKCVVIL